MTTKERLENLERELAAAKRRNRSLQILAALVLVGLFAAGIVLLFTDEIKTRTLYILDAQGKKCALLGTLDDGTPVLEMYDAQGVGRTMLAVGTDGSPWLEMYDAQGVGRTRLVVGTNGSPWMEMNDAQNYRIWSAP